MSQCSHLSLCRDMIATGCEDKNVRVYYLATSSDQPLKVFTGHLAKVFHVRWSPLREGILCSGSDDGWVQTETKVNSGIRWTVYSRNEVKEVTETMNRHWLYVYAVNWMCNFLTPSISICVCLSVQNCSYMGLHTGCMHQCAEWSYSSSQRPDVEHRGSLPTYFR